MNDLNAVPADLADVMPSIRQMLEQNEVGPTPASLSTLRQAASLISSNIEPLLMSDSLGMKEEEEEQTVSSMVVSILNDPSPYSSAASTPMSVMSPSNVSFMPINHNDNGLLSPVKPIPQEDLSQDFNKLFAPASSIKPVKRGKGKGKAKGNGKRQRHHSAQDSLLLRSSLQQQQQQLPLLQQQHQQQQHSFALPNSMPIEPTLEPSVESALSVCVNQQAMDIPSESPFSPEIQDILYGNATLPWMEQSSSFRSHSVPVQFMSQGGSSELSPTDSALPTAPADFSQQIAMLLQGKLRDCGSSNVQEPCRNLMQVMQEGLSCVGRGDHLISGAPFRPPLRYALNAELKARDMYAQGARAGVPTPPSSQNPTPDFSQELPSVHYESAAAASAISSSSAMDTPNSLEPMVDPLLSSVCDDASQRSTDNFAWD
jgi:hypothetical protein